MVPQPRKVHRTFTYYGSLEDGLNIEPEVGAIGAPPGLDTNADYPTLRAIPKETDITVVDYSPDQFECHESINNDSLAAFLERPRPEWSKVRWFNVNGLSWDVIQQICTVYSNYSSSICIFYWYGSCKGARNPPTDGGRFDALSPAYQSGIFSASSLCTASQCSLLEFKY